MVRRLALPVAAVTLGVLLALLAFLQYRWLGQVSEGERQRMRTTLEARARDFAAEFDRELSKAAIAFAPPPGPGLQTAPTAAPSTPGREPARNAPPEVTGPSRQDAPFADLAEGVAQGWDRWQAAASNPALVRAVFVVDRVRSRTCRCGGSTRRRGSSCRPNGPTRSAPPANDGRRNSRGTLCPAAAGRARQPPARLERAHTPSSSSPHLPARVFIDDLSDVPALVVPGQPDVWP